jgi:hypothetical protein
VVTTGSVGDEAAIIRRMTLIRLGHRIACGMDTFLRPGKLAEPRLGLQLVRAR